MISLVLLSLHVPISRGRSGVQIEVRFQAGLIAAKTSS